MKKNEFKKAGSRGDGMGRIVVWREPTGSLEREGHKASCQAEQEAFSLVLPINPLTLSRGASKMMKLFEGVHKRCSPV
jgi:hypothetical protein